ncbi:bifunctional folylpolyglutamate synthase/dihydrofolate synthase [Lentilactobacillus hilgardii]|uniref:bifunctional folylpolyglutamate synthase/dihydrofolate synthase n=1 Tax=Lentilactobacillus hilgardii TaxID=1588 RepID=UPI0021C3C303|nr:folylpolyglutamate synthase/dihydrofolate synthase family protein [Lentilactobacillus hilgardii]MCP9331788.1 bifunctional folylpolyglutamate synthase/dihydrofolate synthase [Lentilactobacillus hilgardii]MCP9348355.1 bifunctional folylpolyglutamate synthase/dihydrofolate synthase [Lentilactobacillus hilgardii]MCP9351203.1 bifunctional folylpolyglutamate synthase/dihydrofolate synthase [Lentilactobacillus hilgardii]
MILRGPEHFITLLVVPSFCEEQLIMTIETYDQALAFIHGRTKFKKIPTLKRMRRFLDELGSPDKRIKAIHIAGTNGKGSTLAFLRNILQEDGLKVGSFTSPFLIRFNERISVNGKPISDNDILRLTNIVYPVVAKLDDALLEGGPTEFEIITAMMFEYFSEGHADIVLVEVGLGGLLDSTNVMTPELSVITTIGWDHMHILGDTLPKIAYQKAGIIKPKVPVVVGKIPEAPLKVIEHTASGKKSPMTILGKQFTVNNLGMIDWEQHFSFKSDHDEFNDLSTGLIGDYQTDNAALAIQAYLNYCQLSSRPVNHNSVIAGIKQTKWGGRFERINDHPTIVIDGAHNISAVDEIVDLLESNFSKGKVYVLMGILADKQAEKMVEKMATVKNVSIILTSFNGPGKRNTADPQVLEEQVDSKERKKTVTDVIDDWQTAIDTIQKKLMTDDMLLITGSLYFISDVRKYLLASLN